MKTIRSIKHAMRFFGNWCFLSASELAYYISVTYLLKEKMNGENWMSFLVLFCFLTMIVSSLFGFLSCKLLENQYFLCVFIYGLISGLFYYYVLDNIFNINSAWYPELFWFIFICWWIICLTLFSIFSIIRILPKRQNIKNEIEISWEERMGE